jgi:hypothetical protein
MSTNETRTPSCEMLGQDDPLVAIREDVASLSRDMGDSRRLNHWFSVRMANYIWSQNEVVKAGP